MVGLVAGFLLAVLLLAFFVSDAIRQMKNPAYWMLGLFALFLSSPLLLILLFLAVEAID